MRGRPPLADGEARARVLTLRLTPAEWSELEAEAERKKQTVSQIARKRIANSYRLDRELLEHSKRLAERAMQAEANLKAVMR